MKVPVPFVGWIELNDLEDMEQMLRKQIETQQNEIMRLHTEVRSAYKKGWDEAIVEATQRVKDVFDGKI